MNYFQLEKAEESKYVVRLNPEHILYQAHFPNFAILPGSCISEIIKEALQMENGKEFRLRSVKTMKFIQPICPDEISTLQLSFTQQSSEEQTNVKATLRGEECIFCKSDLIFVQE